MEQSNNSLQAEIIESIFSEKIVNGMTDEHYHSIKLVMEEYADKVNATKLHQARELLKEAYTEFIGAAEMSDKDYDKQLMKRIKTFLDGTR